MKFQVYKDKIGQYRWRLIATNGRVIADSGEGYVNKSDCLAGIQLVKQFASTAPIQDQTAGVPVRSW